MLEGAAQSDTFLGKLKTAWDIYFKKNDALILVLCGSASTWIEKNILSSTGFLGRISWTLTLEELPLRDCAQFWPQDNISAYEKAKVLSVTGGVPQYLEEIDPSQSSDENIKRMCFTRTGLLVSDFERIFNDNDLFLRNSDYYKRIVAALASGAKDHQEIAKSLGAWQNGKLSEYLDELVIAGFIRRDYTWDIKTGLDKPKQSKFRLSDNYLRFYLKYMQPKLTQIQRDVFRFMSMETLPEWPTVMGLQFENLVLGSRQALHQAIGLDPNSITNENPYFQKPGLRQPGCQIDFMIQARFSCLYACEIRFSVNPIGAGVISEVKDRIKKIKRPKSYSCRPVLIHINGVTAELTNSEFFSDIIDMSTLLTPE